MTTDGPQNPELRHDERRHDLPRHDDPWRSLEGRRDPRDPRQVELRGREFPVGASEAPDGPTRRTVLGLMGASAALAGLTGCRRPEEEIVPFVQAPETLVPGLPQQYATAWTLGSAGYGTLVSAREGRPVKIEGNELHPASHGAANVWMQASILGLYDPDRSPKVLRDTEGTPTPATWEDFASFWGDVAYDLVDTRGAGLAVLIEPYASPSLHRMVERLRGRFDGARVAVWGPVDDEAIFEGLRRATGRAARPLHHLDRARVILALDADLLLTETNGLAHSRGFAIGRGAEVDRRNRLYAVESQLSLTGANADHRLRLQSRRMPAFIAALAVALGERGVPVRLPAEAAAPSLPAEAAEALPEIAADLVAAGGEALVAAGRSQPAEVHALAWEINRALGAVGRTVEAVPLRDVGVSSAEDLRALVAAMEAGEVRTLVIVGGNPVYDAPADLGFAEVLEQVDDVVHLASHRDETSRRASWHLPRSHPLEAWGDTRGPDGTPSVIQPLISPLFDTRSDLELMDLLAGDSLRPGQRLVRATWLELLGGDDFEARWRRVLHDGVAAPELLTGPAATAVGPDAPAGEPADQATGGAADAFVLARQPVDGLELTFQVSRAVHDGRFANIAWLQELPDPLTKITWDNAALVSPATARELGVTDGDLLRLTVGEASVEAPVWRQPGQADGSIALALGYGRTAAGRVGDGVGVSAYPLRTAAAPWTVAVTAQAAGGRHQLAQTQEHWAMEGRHLARYTTVQAFARDSHAMHPAEHGPPLESLWQEHSYDQGHRWGMSIDLDACTGCNACVVACQSENNIPVVGRQQVMGNREMHWLRVDRYFEGGEDDPKVLFQPVPCQHCENAPCEQVCPVAATVHDAEGLNLMVYNRCIGTRYCSNNCPYKVRRFNFFNYTRAMPELMHLAMNPEVTVRSRGVMEKCTFCLQRIMAVKAEAKRDDRRAIADGEIQTACQQTCPTGAIVFGDLNDPAAEVTRDRQDPRGYSLLAFLNNKPRATYLGRLRHPNPALEDPLAGVGDSGHGGGHGGGHGEGSGSEDHGGEGHGSDHGTAGHGEGA